MKKFKNLENIGIPQSAYIKKGMVRAVNQKYRMLNLTQPQKVNNNYVINAAIMALYDKSNLDVFAGSSTKEEIMANYQTTPRQLMAKRSIPDKTEIFKRDEFRCKKCGRIFPENLLICGHIIPLASGGSNHSTNLQTLCISCHKQKTKEDVKRIQEYREKLQKLKMFW